MHLPWSMFYRMPITCFIFVWLYDFNTIIVWVSAFSPIRFLFEMLNMIHFCFYAFNTIRCSIWRLFNTFHVLILCHYHVLLSDFMLLTRSLFSSFFLIAIAFGLFVFNMIHFRISAFNMVCFLTWCFWHDPFFDFMSFNTIHFFIWCM